MSWSQCCLRACILVVVRNSAVQFLFIVFITLLYVLFCWAIVIFTCALTIVSRVRLAHTGKAGSMSSCKILSFVHRLYAQKNVCRHFAYCEASWGTLQVIHFCCLRIFSRLPYSYYICSCSVCKNCKARKTSCTVAPC